MLDVGPIKVDRETGNNRDSPQRTFNTIPPYKRFVYFNIVCIESQGQLIVYILVQLSYFASFIDFPNVNVQSVIA